MSFIQVTIFLGLLCNIINGASTKNETKVEPRIVGGTAATPGQFPYQVSLMLRVSSTVLSHYCGGSIINSNHVLTAAHCVNDVSPESLVVWAGANQFHIGGYYNSATHVFVHEKYVDKGGNDNDIAIIRLKDRHIFTIFIQPVSLNYMKIKDKTSCTVSGWGTMQEGGPASNYLQYTVVNKIIHESCKRQYQGFDSITENMLCASAAGKDSCQGDSGGPLVCNDRLAGIVSFGVGCARPQYPGVYTNVSIYTQWIEDQLIRSFASKTLSQINIIAMIISMTLYTVLY